MTFPISFYIIFNLYNGAKLHILDSGTLLAYSSTTSRVLKEDCTVAIVVCHYDGWKVWACTNHSYHVDIGLVSFLLLFRIICNKCYVPGRYEICRMESTIRVLLLALANQHLCCGFRKYIMLPTSVFLNAKSRSLRKGSRYSTLNYSTLYITNSDLSCQCRGWITSFSPLVCFIVDTYPQ